MPTALELTSEELSRYREFAQQRQEDERRELAIREAKAWDLARQAASLLVKQFRAEHVVVFGSLVCANGFTIWSDVDIAAWGIQPQDTFKAIGAVMDLSDKIIVSLVDVNTCSASLLAVIE